MAQGLPPVSGVVVKGPNPLNEDNDFEWLADLQKSQCYTTCDWAHPSKTSDFGCGGYTASLTDWHELLQLTAPSRDCGIVFVRGDFPDSVSGYGNANLDALLARAQMRDNTGNKGTFDIHFLHDDLDRTKPARGGKRTRYKLGPRRAQGIANFRWPYTQYELRLQQESAPDEWKEVRKGSYEGISFVKDGTMYQISRLSMADEAPRGKLGQPQASGVDYGEIQFKIGGRVKFGCSCSGGVSRGGGGDVTVELVRGGRLLVYKSRLYPTHRLEIQVFVNGTARVMELAGETFTATLIVEMGAASRYVVSTYTLRDVSRLATGAYPMIERVKASVMEDYVGVANTSLEMTDKLWLASLSKQFEALETVEICAIARCVEQILGVIAVPIEGDIDPLRVLLQRNEEDDDFENEYGLALIQNIVTSQYVSLESCFWQIRFLVKAIQFLESQTFLSSLLEESEKTYLRRMRTSYVERIRRHIRLALIWITKADVIKDKILLPTRPESASESPNMLAHGGGQQKVKVDSSYDQKCFIRLAVWYVLKHCQSVITPMFRDYLSAHKLKTVLPDDEIGDSGVDKESNPKNDVLKWLDSSCLFLLWEELHAEGDDDTIPQAESERILNLQMHREKIAKRLRKSQSEPYSTNDEEVDRLYLLGDELGFRGIPSGTTFDLADARARQTRLRIAKRKSTEVFSCGPRSSNTRKLTKVTSTAPWELSVLNHHSLLKASLDQSQEINQRDCRDACFQFILSDYTFMVSWDRTDKGMLGTWWDVASGAVICSTLLDMIRLAKQDLSISRRETEDPLSRSGIIAGPNARLLDEFVEKMISQIQAKQNEQQASRTFDWFRYKPRRYFHLNSWVQSLDDTPEIFQKMKPAFAPQMTGLKRYLTSDTGSAVPLEESYKIETISKKIEADDLEFLSIFDFRLNDDLSFEDRRIVLDRGPGVRKTQLARHHALLLDSLNDSLVDLDIKYRILFAERCCPKLVSGFSYIWHRDALDTWENYFSTTSHFLDKRESTIWTTSITLSHWSLSATLPTSPSPSTSILPSTIDVDHARFTEHFDNAGRTHGTFPPPSVASSGRYLQERSTSLVITGDSQGFNWICSLWSPLTDAKKMQDTLADVSGLLGAWIHRQATGRCLVFLILLGHVCGELKAEYEGILNHLDAVVELEDKIFFEGLEWDENDPTAAVNKLKRMIWGGQALRILEDRLSSSLAQIRNAKEALDRTIRTDEGQQDVELAQGYVAVLEGFEKRWGALEGLQIRVQQKIKHLVGLRDGISTVNFMVDSRHALRDSQTTIRQGNNIRVLTLITILFLPLSYITGLFSENHNVLPDSAGRALYTILAVVLTMFTFGVAFLLQWEKLAKIWETRW